MHRGHGTPDLDVASNVAGIGCRQPPLQPYLRHCHAYGHLHSWTRGLQAPECAQETAILLGVMFSRGNVLNSSNEVDFRRLVARGSRRPAMPTQRCDDHADPLRHKLMQRRTPLFLDAVTATMWRSVTAERLGVCVYHDPEQSARCNANPGGENFQKKKKVAEG